MASDETADKKSPFGGERQAALKLLEEHHDFPCPYMFKVIGFSDCGLEEEVKGVAQRILGSEPAEGELRTRHSGKKRYLSVTLEMEVASAGQVAEMYAGLRGIQGLVALI